MPKYTITLITTEVVEVEATDVYDCDFQATELAKEKNMQVSGYYKNDNQPNTNQDED